MIQMVEIVNKDINVIIIATPHVQKPEDILIKP